MIDDQSENLCLVGLLNIDVYSSGVEESNSKPVTYKYDYQLCVKMQDGDTQLMLSPL